MLDNWKLLRLILSKLNDVVKNEVVKKTQYNELVKRVNVININNTSDLVKKNMTITQKLMKLKKKVIIIMLNMLLFNKIFHKWI